MSKPDDLIVGVIATFIQQEVGVGQSELIRLQARELLDHMRERGVVVVAPAAWFTT